MRSTLRKASGILAALLLTALPLAGTSQAGTKDFYPWQFKPMYDDDYHSTVNSFSYLSAWNLNGQFYVTPVRLPPGSRLTGVTLFYEGGGDGRGTVEIRWTKLGQEEGILGHALSEAGHNTGEMVEVEGMVAPHAYIRPGRKHFLRVSVHNDASRVYGVRLFYE